jgi:hypothetical protein
VAKVHKGCRAREREREREREKFQRKVEHIFYTQFTFPVRLTSREIITQME